MPSVPYTTTLPLPLSLSSPRFPPLLAPLVGAAITSPGAGFMCAICWVLGISCTLRDFTNLPYHCPIAHPAAGFIPPAALSTPGAALIPPANGRPSASSGVAS